MYFDHPLLGHHALFHQELDHGLAVLRASTVQVAPQESATLVHMVRAAFPLHGRVALLCQGGLFLFASLEPLGDLLAAGRQSLPRHDLLLIRLKEALQLPLPRLSLRVNTVQLCLALALLPSLYGLPQGLFWQHGLRGLEPLTDQGPHQGIQTVSTHTTGGTTLHAPHCQWGLAGTAIIPLRIALADTQLPRRLQGQLPLSTSHERPRRWRLRGTTGLGLVLFELCLCFWKGRRTEDGRRRDGSPLLWGTRLPGILVLARGQLPSGLRARHARFGSLVVPLPRRDGVAEHPAHPGHRPHGVLTSPRRHVQRVQSFDNLARGPLCLDQPGKHIPYHLGLCGMAFDPRWEPSVCGHIAVAIRPIRPRQSCGFPRCVQPAAARPVGPLPACICGDHPWQLGSELAVRSIPKGMLQDNDPASILLERFPAQPWRRITAGEPIRREEDDRLKCAEAGLVSQTLEGRTVSTTTPDPIVKKEVFRHTPWCLNTSFLVVRGHVCVERLPLTLAGLRFLLLARRDAGIPRYVHGGPPSAWRK